MLDRDDPESVAIRTSVALVKVRTDVWVNCDVGSNPVASMPAAALSLTGLNVYAAALDPQTPLRTASMQRGVTAGHRHVSHHAHRDDVREPHCAAVAQYRTAFDFVVTVGNLDVITAALLAAVKAACRDLVVILPVP